MLIRVVIILILLVGGVPSLEAQDTVAAVVMDRCPFLIPANEIEGRTLECGYLVTLENPHDPDSAVINIAFTILYATETADSVPLFYLEGGPGSSALVGLVAWLGSPLRLRRDIVLIDQRGAGYSQPSLDCGSVSDRACRQRLLEASIDLTQYHSINSAHDIAILIEQLGYIQVDVLGVSYGSRLALTLMRDYPAHLRSVVLDSAFPPVVNAYEQQARAAQRAFDVLFEACRMDVTCAVTYPNLESIFYELVRELDANPVMVDGEQLNGGAMVEYVYGALFDPHHIVVLPAAIFAAKAGDFDTALQPPMVESETLYAVYSSAEVESFYRRQAELAEAEGAFIAAECREELPFNSLQRAHELAQIVHPSIARLMVAGVEIMFDRCERWDVGSAPLKETEPVVSELPTLVLAGQFDPVTPPDWGQIAAATLSNSYFYEFPGATHAVMDGGDCPMRMILDFLDNPFMAPDSSCIETMGIDFQMQAGPVQ